MIVSQEYIQWEQQEHTLAPGGGGRESAHLNHSHHPGTTHPPIYPPNCPSPANPTPSFTRTNTNAHSTSGPLPSCPPHGVSVCRLSVRHAAFPVDTHIHRLAQRWGLSNGKSVEQTVREAGGPGGCDSCGGRGKRSGCGGHG